MLKNDTKDQFPLFELPAPAGSADQPAPPKAKPHAAAEVKPALPGRTKMKKAAPVQEGRRTREAKTAPKGVRSAKPSPGPVPEGDVRLTANIREDLHLKLKIVAATRRTTIGELIEDLVEHHL